MGEMRETITEFAAKQQRAFDAKTTESERRERGHFGTPPEIAEFMAGMFTDIPTGTVRVLDAGAGVGVLTAAICHRVSLEKDCRQIVAELWENDAKLEPYLRATLHECQSSTSRAGHSFQYAIRCEDFILGNGQRTLFSNGPIPSFHLAILNPPYYKLRKDSAQARAMEHVVHGQPNIYALFMAAVADLLLPGGQMVAITPRSYFNGPYFKKFRKWFFDRMTVRQIHIFESRTEAFRDDGVLQENVILLAEKSAKVQKVALTCSVGRLFPNAGKSMVPYKHVIEDSTGDHIVRVAAGDAENGIVAAIDRLPCRIRDLNLEISTGPVVTFRATEFLRDRRSHDTAPLLWMHNVRPFVTQFPSKSGKPSHIEVSEASKRLLVPATRYVLLKRFTSKEERRRLVAGIVETTDSYSPWLGLENHLNYIYRKSKELTRSEAFGLAAFLNSSLVDRYFRMISGNTQVNATEIRAMPIPDQATLLLIGQAIEASSDRNDAAVEGIVARALALPQRLTEQLCEGAK